MKRQKHSSISPGKMSGTGRVSKAPADVSVATSGGRHKKPESRPIQSNPAEPAMNMQSSRGALARFTTRFTTRGLPPSNEAADSSSSIGPVRATRSRWESLPGISDGPMPCVQKSAMMIRSSMQVQTAGESAVASYSSGQTSRSKQPQVLLHTAADADVGHSTAVCDIGRRWMREQWRRKRRPCRAANFF
eukprot:scaffold2450_cov128-Isochrysis_galbana.AAC.1